MRIEGSILRVFAGALARSVWTYLVIIGTLLTLVLIPRNWYWIIPSGICVVVVLGALRAVQVVRNEAQSEIASLKARLRDEPQPELRVSNIQRVGADQAVLSVANLATSAALVKKLMIGTGGRREQGIAPQDIENFPLRFLVAGGQIEDQTIHMQLGAYRRKYSPPPVVGARSQWQASFSVALVYDCGGTEKQTPWRDFSATLWDYTVVDLVCPDEPST